jgi:predicted Zn finger-like uncharacterized protein
MDVRCDQCGTEYELDDDRLAHEPVTVKCASCGYIFKVRGQEQAAPPVPSAAAKKANHWMVRQQNGNILTFKELTTLQKWIVERKVTREDEISKSGETWKRLGSIAELASFFQVVDVPPPPPALPPMQPPPTSQPQHQQPTQAYPMPPMQQGMPPLPPGSMPPMQGMPPYMPQQITGSYGAYPYPPAGYPGSPYPPPPGYPVYPYPPQMMDPNAYPPGSMPPVPQGSMPPLPQTSLPPAPRAATVAPPPPAQPALGMDEELDEDDPVRGWQRRRRLGLVFSALAFLLVLGGVGAFLAMPQEAQALVEKVKAALGLGTPPEVVAAVDGARANLLKASRTSLQACTQQADDALKRLPGLPEALALKSLCITLTGLGITEEKLELGGQMGVPGVSETEIAALRERLVQLTQAEGDTFKGAFELARASVQAAPNATTTNSAVAAYYAARGAPREAVPYVERATGAASPADQVFAWVRAELMAQDKGTRARAQEEMELLSGNRNAWVLARYRLAAWKVADKDSGAAAAVESLLKADPSHARGLAMAAHLKAMNAPPPVVEKPVETPPVVEEKPVEKPVEKPAEKDPPAEEKPKVKMTFDRLLAQADRTKDKGSSSRAAGLYMKAMEMEPERAEPHVGLGWCFLDQEKYSAAMGEFDRAIQLNPSYAEAFLGLGEVYKFKGDKFGAIKNYQKYLTILPDGPEAAVAKNNINQLKGN